MSLPALREFCQENSVIGKVVVKCHMGIVRVQVGLGFAAAHRLPRLVGSKLALRVVTDPTVRMTAVNQNAEH